MEIKQYELTEQNIAKLKITLSKETFEKSVNSAYLKQRGSITLPGFRRGKVPRKMIEKMYGDDTFHEEALNLSLPDIFQFAVDEKELKPIAQGWVENAEMNKETGEMELEMAIPNYPVVELPTYTGVSAPRREPEVDEADIDERIEQVRKRNASVITTERPAENGDTVVIDYTGYVGSVPFQGGKGENHYLELGSHSFISGFEEQLVGLSAGDDAEVNVTFPEDYHSDEVKGKDATFKVHIHEVKVPSVPELDDEFARDVSEFETIAEYRESIRQELLGRKEDACRDEFLDGLLKKIIAETKINLHDALIEDRTESLVSRQASQLGIDTERYIELFERQGDEVKKSMRDRAENHLRSELVLLEIGKLENLELTDEDRDAEYAKLAEDYGVDAESVKTFVDQDAFESSAHLKKIADWLIAQSVAEPWVEEDHDHDHDHEGHDHDHSHEGHNHG